MTAPMDNPLSLEKLAGALTEAQRRAMLAMTEDFQFPGRSTFTAGGAWSASVAWRSLVERQALPVRVDRPWRRDAYRLTPAGLRVRQHLQNGGGE